MQGYFSKTCILKQTRSGYSSDGSPLSGIVRLESFGSKFRAEVSLINFAPLADGNYCCVLSDKSGGSYSFPLAETGGSAEGGEEFSPEIGFLCVICYAGREEYHPVAYCLYGENVYDSGKLLLKLFTLRREASLHAVRDMPEENDKTPVEEERRTPEKEPSPGAENAEESADYDDEAIADENYYAFSSDGTTEENLSSTSVIRVFKAEGGDTYFRSIKSELDEIFNSNPSDYSLREIYPHSLWVRISQGEEKGNLIGIIHENLTVKYICYAVRKRDGVKQPENSQFVPENMFLKPDGSAEGYYVTFRFASTGEYASLSDE